MGCAPSGVRRLAPLLLHEVHFQVSEGRLHVSRDLGRRRGPQLVGDDLSRVDGPTRHREVRMDLARARAGNEPDVLPGESGQMGEGPV